MARSLKHDILFFIGIALAGGLLFSLSGALHPAVYGLTEGATLTGMVLMTVTTAGLFVWNGLFLLLVVSLIAHVFAGFVEDSPDYEKALKTVIYAAAPPMLLVWAVVFLPGASYTTAMIGAVFSLLMFFGARGFQQLSNDRALFVSLSTSLFILFLLYVTDAPWFFGP